MSYPAIDVKALYDRENRQMEIKLEFIDTMLHLISEDNLDTSSEQIKPYNTVVKNIESYFEKNIDKKKLKKEAEKIDAHSQHGITENEFIIGMVYIDEYGEIDHITQYKEYANSGPSQKQIINKFT